MSPGSPATRAIRPWKATFAFVAAVSVAACGDNQPAAHSHGDADVGPDVDIGGKVDVALGGTSADGNGFVPLEGDVALIPGSQGGFHVWIKYRVTGARVGPMRVAYTARRVSDNRLILNSGRVQELGAAGDAGYWESPVAIPAFMCPSPLGVQVRDESIRFKLEIFDLGGVLLGGAEAQATPHCQLDAQSTFCIRICSG